MRCHPCKPALACWLVAALVLLSCGLAQAQEFDGAWKLTIRKLPTGDLVDDPRVELIAGNREPCRTGLAAGGSRIRTIGPPSGEPPF